MPWSPIELPVHQECAIHVSLIQMPLHRSPQMGGGTDEDVRSRDPDQLATRSRTRVDSQCTTAWNARSPPLRPPREAAPQALSELVASSLASMALDQLLGGTFSGLDEHQGFPCRRIRQCGRCVGSSSRVSRRNGRQSRMSSPLSPSGASLADAREGTEPNLEFP